MKELTAMREAAFRFLTLNLNRPIRRLISFGHLFDLFSFVWDDRYQWEFLQKFTNSVTLFVLGSHKLDLTLVLGCPCLRLEFTAAILSVLTSLLLSSRVSQVDLLGWHLRWVYLFWESCILNFQEVPPAAGLYDFKVGVSLLSYATVFMPVRRDCGLFDM